MLRVLIFNFLLLLYIDVLYSQSSLLYYQVDLDSSVMLNDNNTPHVFYSITTSVLVPVQYNFDLGAGFGILNSPLTNDSKLIEKYNIQTDNHSYVLPFYIIAKKYILNGKLHRVSPYLKVGYTMQISDFDYTSHTITIDNQQFLSKFDAHAKTYLILGMEYSYKRSLVLGIFYKNIAIREKIENYHYLVNKDDSVILQDAQILTDRTNNHYLGIHLGYLFY